MFKMPINIKDLKTVMSLVHLFSFCFKKKILGMCINLFSSHQRFFVGERSKPLGVGKDRWAR